MNHLVSGTDPQTSARTASIPNYRVFSTELLSFCENKAVPTHQTLNPAQPISIITSISKLIRIHHIPQIPHK